MTITADFFKGYENTKDPEMDFRRREREKVSFYRSGAIKAVYLNEQIRIETWYGEISAELITFYEDSTIKRIFADGMHADNNSLVLDEEGYILSYI